MATDTDAVVQTQEQADLVSKQREVRLLALLGIFTWQFSLHLPLRESLESAYPTARPAWERLQSSTPQIQWT